VNFDAMMKENAAQDGSSSAFQHDVIYFLHSAFVHSTANSMRSFRRLKSQQYFTAELGPNGWWKAEALGGANIFLFQILQSAALYLGLRDIEVGLDGLFERLRRQAGATPGIAAEGP
jgi:hypothetical protein